MSSLTPADISAGLQGAVRYGVLAPDDVEAARGIMRVRELARGEYLLRGGAFATECGYVVSGVLREHFVTSKGVERTKSFVLAGEPTGSLADLLAGAPSRAFIVAEEPTRVVLSSFADYQSLCRTRPAWARIAMLHMQEVLIRKAEREYEFLCMDAEERYAAFRARHPGLEARVAGRHVASFLGITPVHLSRLRKRRIESGRAARAVAR